MPQHKKCPKCGEIKPVDRFSKSRSRKDGLQSQCKDCARRHYEETGRERKRQWRNENREALREYNRRYYDENREAVRERHRRYHRRYYKENREAKLECNRRYYEENREAECESQRQRREENRDISREVATRNGMSWAEAEDSFILSADMSNLEAAVELGRTENSVANRKRRLRKNIQTI